MRHVDRGTLATALGNAPFGKDLQARLVLAFRQADLPEAELDRILALRSALPPLREWLAEGERIRFEMACLAEHVAQEGIADLDIYGAGVAGRNLLASARARGIRVHGFHDGNPDLHGMLDGLPVTGPEGIQDEAPRALAVAALRSREEIVDRLRRRGIGERRRILAGRPEFLGFREFPEWRELPTLDAARRKLEAFLEAALDSGVTRSAVFLALGFPNLLKWFRPPERSEAAQPSSPFIYTMQ